MELVLPEEVLAEVASSARCWVLEAVELSALFGTADCEARKAILEDMMFEEGCWSVIVFEVVVIGAGMLVEAGVLVCSVLVRDRFPYASGMGILEGSGWLLLSPRQVGKRRLST